MRHYGSYLVQLRGAPEHELRGARHVDVVVALAPLDRQGPARQHDLAGPLGAARQHAGDGDGARARAARQRDAAAPLPDDHVDVRGVDDVDELGVDLLGEGRRVHLDGAARDGQVDGAGVVDERHRVRVAHRHGRDAVLAPGGLERRVHDARAVRGGERAGHGGAVQDRLAHVDGDAAVRQHERHDGARARGDGEGLAAPPRRARRPELAEVRGEAADPVAAHLGLGAVRVVDRHAEVVRRVAGHDEDDAVRAHAEVAVAEPLRLRRRRLRRRGVAVVDEQEVVAQALVLGELERGRAQRHAPGPPPRGRDQRVAGAREEEGEQHP